MHDTFQKVKPSTTQASSSNGVGLSFLHREGPIPQELALSTVAFVPLTRGFLAIIDAEDFQTVSRYRWNLSIDRSTSYATYRRNTPTQKISLKMHRVIMNAPRGTIIDHKNRHGLDNRKSNLRFTTRSLNAVNGNAKGSSRYRGVSYVKKNHLWISTISIEGKQKTLGYFKTETEAALSYNKAALKHYGDFARLNSVFSTSLPLKETTSIQEVA